MNILYFFLAITVFAADCTQYELRGTVTKKEDVILTVNEGTNSQKVFRFSHKVELAVAPFIGKFMRGVFTVEDSLITKVEKPDLAVPDPLFHHGSIKCKIKGQPKLPSSKKI